MGQHLIVGNTGGAFATPLRYPGGKGRLGPWIANVIHSNDIAGGWYIEPYAGGAGAALFLLTHGHVAHIVINDIDPVLHSFWRAATEQSRDLVNMVLTTPVTIETWLRQREIIENPTKFDFVAVGFACFFLNRTNRSGILSAGVIGGKAQAGSWKLDARYNVGILCQRILQVGRLAPRITVLGMDALDLLTDAAPGFPKKTLVYLDPPYYGKGSQLYRNFYGPDDHLAISQYVKQADVPIIVTYDACEEILMLYEGMRGSKFSLYYSTHAARPRATEVLFYNNLNIPVAPSMTRGHVLPSNFS